ncbi:chemotaxis protein CheB [Thermomonas flagellata]|uniref:chemotaxis protein CheB n=1 Tax=Thermomonas flagellata TaxID=2888524 RepID=UPI001F045C2D|nr:chemotaxis protein CheB [Thermomonas flagellata]
MNRRRVVLLARPGVACERTQEALAQAGAELAACLDPLVADEALVRAHAPEAVLVVLDPMVEQVLDRYQGLLADPTLDALFEDADVAARREGWEAARWARHLRAKLHGHADVLPPAAGAAAAGASGGMAEADLRFEEDMRRIQLAAAQVELDPAADRRSAPRLAGAVVIAAGLGGPDVVRQLLAALPAHFPRPVVLDQRIEGGHYDRLVRQMQRVSALPVVLAQAGEPLRAGSVYVLPARLDVVAAPGGLQLAEVAGDPRFAALPPADSALLLLSGADAGLVDTALAIRLGGGLALGQAADNCYDPAASQQLVARGGEAEPVAGLVRRLLQRWSA